MRPYIPATGNPDRIGEKIVWADRPEDLMEDLLQGHELPPGIDPPLPMSVTQIRAFLIEQGIRLAERPSVTLPGGTGR